MISAVGHEPDFTISDFVADLRAATPSNAAELAVPDQAEIREQLSDKSIRLTRSAQHLLQQRRALLASFSQRRALTDPTGYLAMKRLDLDHMQKDLLSAAESGLELARHQLATHASALDAMSPMKVLARGYTVASKPDGTVIRSVNEAETGAHIRVRLQDGALHCTVDTKEKPDG